MNRCKKCGIFVSDESEKCPLCKEVLEKDGEGIKTYPDVIREKRHMHFVYRLLLFISIVTGIACALINYYVTPQDDWSLIVIASLIYGMVMFYQFVDDNAGYRKRIFVGAIGGVLLVIIVDYLTGFHGWSLDYVLPGAVVLVDVAFLILMLVNRRNWQSYLVLQILMILMGVIPLVLLRVGLIENEIMAVASFWATVILFVGSITLGGQTALNELKRRFHI